MEPYASAMRVRFGQDAATASGAETGPHALIGLLLLGLREEDFVDNDISAANPAVERPQWFRLLAALGAGEVDQVVAYDQSRLTRQPLEWEQSLVVCADRSIRSVQACGFGGELITFALSQPTGGLTIWRTSLCRPRGG